MPPKRIFLSATSRDLKGYRELASYTLRQRGYDVDHQEIFHLTFGEIGDKLEQRIQSCDAVICLIGLVYGAEPSDRPPGQPRRSYTQWEYILARKLDKPVYLLLADETSGVSQSLEPRRTLSPSDPASSAGAGPPRSCDNDRSRTFEWPGLPAKPPITELKIPAITSVLAGRALETSADEPGSASPL